MSPPRDKPSAPRPPNRFLRAATQVTQQRHLSEFTNSPPQPGQQPPDYAQPSQGVPAIAKVPNISPADLATQIHHPHGNAGGLAPSPAVAPAPQPNHAPWAPANSMAPQSHQPQLHTGRGKVITLFGCRGGSGATTIAVNMASQLIRLGKRVCILDLDLQLGDVFVALDLDPRTSIAALAREATTIDGAALLRRLARHDSGIYAITQTGRLEDIDEGLVESIPVLLTTMTQHFDYVIVDGVRDFGDYALSVLDVADQVAMVLAQDVASVRRAARVITLYRQLGYDTTKLRLILSRTTRTNALPIEEVERALAMRITAHIRNDYKSVRAAFDQGALLADVASKSKVNADITALAHTLCGIPMPAPAATGLRAWLGRRTREKAAQGAQQATPLEGR